jgi:sigma-B regulation protein RsbU (phosphoserine phosphatase)
MTVLTNSSLDSVLTKYSLKVLLIDDQAIIGTSVQNMLASEPDILLKFCSDPTQALPTAFAFEPTLILLDLIMPEVEGLSLVKFFRAHPRFQDVPLIVMSSKEEAKTKAEAFALGANDYLVKLPDRIELIARIRYHSQAYITLLQRNEAFQCLQRSQKALADDLERAVRYVMSLLPEPLTEGPVRTHWRFFPSTQLGGDAFGYHWIDPDHFAMYLLDVCGHGVGSALLSVAALNVLKNQSLPDVNFHDPAQVLGRLNEQFPMEQHNDLYFTIWYGVFQPSKNQIKHASAGHPPALLIGAGGEVSELIKKNLFIGSMSGVEYRSTVTSLPENARLYILSDGVYEVLDHQDHMFGLSGLKAFLAKTSPDIHSEIDDLYTKMLDWREADLLDDDFSLLRIDFCPHFPPENKA